MVMETEAGRRRRLLTAGDVEGRLAQLFQQVENQQKRVGAFDVLLSVGAFLPGAGPEAKERAAVLAEYVAGKRQAPLETYFIERSSAALIQAAPEGKELCKGVHFLGGFGVRQICGLRVAYLSGHYDPAVYGAQEAGAAGAPFVGAAFTPQAIEALTRLVKQPGAPPLDLLLTSDWPSHLEERLDDADRPRHPDGAPVKWHEVTAPPIAALCLALEPRYHVFGGMDLFYQRPPFQTREAGHVCRCIALGKVGSKGKGRTWVHGLQLAPASEMEAAALRQRPDSTTPCPFALPEPAAAAGEGTGGAPSLKRCAAELEAGGAGEGEQDDAAQVVPDQVFLSRLPPNIEEQRIEKALKHVGKILRVHFARDEGAEGRPCKGFGWVTFSSPEEAQAACDLSEMLECGGRKIGICLSRRSGQGAKRREAQIVIEPHADCWFCLVNPKAEKHMIVDATTEVYVATAKGPVHRTHVLVLPVKHAPCFAACPPELQRAIQAHIVAIRRMCQHSGQDCIVWERWIPMASSGANHMQVQVLPISRERAGEARDVLMDMARRHLPDRGMKRIGGHEEVAEHLNDDASTPYIYFEVPGDSTAKGREVERYVYAGVGGGPRIPVNLGRMYACRLLDCEDKLDWRQCQDDRGAEKELAKAFREKFLPFQPQGK